MVNLFGERPQTNPAAVQQIKQWANEAFQFAEDAHLMITELRCSEPGCPPIETVIAVLLPGQAPRQYKLHKAAGEVTHEDILALAKLGLHQDLR